ncbi:hypothetical protein H9X90_02580 [Faecalicatena contorta]|nr:hypothetical protein [Faecalicatena contorta]
MQKNWRSLIADVILCKSITSAINVTGAQLCRDTGTITATVALPGIFTYIISTTGDILKDIDTIEMAPGEFACPGVNFT